MSNEEIEEIKSLQKKRVFFNALKYVPSFQFFRDRCDKKKQVLINSILDEVVYSSDLMRKYSAVDLTQIPPIGNRIWMFWYTGFDTAPDLVKKCTELAKSLDDADVVLIDKSNLEEFFSFEGNIKELFENGKITIQTFSDILRTQLLSRRGGFWFDATLMPLRKDFITVHSRQNYFSIKHARNDMLLKKKWNEFFTEGRWSTYCNGAGIGNPVFSFIYDVFISYYKLYDSIFDYWQIDYIWLYCYEHFDWAKAIIDSTQPSVNCSYNFHSKLLKEFDPSDWNKTIRENEFQKLGWRVIAKQGRAHTDNQKETYYDHFLSFSL